MCYELFAYYECKMTMDIIAPQNPTKKAKCFIVTGDEFGLLSTISLNVSAFIPFENEC